MGAEPHDGPLAESSSTAIEGSPVSAAAGPSAAKDLTNAVLAGVRFSVLTGEPGISRSAIVDTVAIALIDAGNKVVRVRNNAPGTFGLGRLVVLLLGGQYTRGTDDGLRRVVELLTHPDHRGKRFVVVVEDADMAEPAAWKLLRLLPELQREGSPRAQILLVGRPGLWTSSIHRSNPLTEMSSSAAANAAVPRPVQNTVLHHTTGAEPQPTRRRAGRVAGASGASRLLSQAVGKPAPWALLVIVFALASLVLLRYQWSTVAPESLPQEDTSRAAELAPPAQAEPEERHDGSVSQGQQELPQAVPSRASVGPEDGGGTLDGQPGATQGHNEPDTASALDGGTSVPQAEPPSPVSFRGQIRNIPMNRKGGLFVVTLPQTTSGDITAHFDAGTGLSEPGEFSGYLSEGHHVSIHGRLMVGNTAYFCYLSGAITGNKLTGSVRFVPSSGGRVVRNNFTLVRS